MRSFWSARCVARRVASLALSVEDNCWWLASRESICHSVPSGAAALLTLMLELMEAGASDRAGIPCKGSNTEGTGLDKTSGGSRLKSGAIVGVNVDCCEVGGAACGWNKDAAEDDSSRCSEDSAATFCAIV